MYVCVTSFVYFEAMGKDPWALRSNQKLQSFLRFYGSSLEGNISKTIVTQLDTPKKAYSDMKNSKKINVRSVKYLHKIRMIVLCMYCTVVIF